MSLHALRILPVFFGLVHLNRGQLIHDARCFLENGVTAAHLFVSEDLPVGSTLGLLAVIGDPGPQGDIKLTLQERDSPVAISPYSKNLTLVRPLDKEGVLGPASVYVNVICERKHAIDPGFVIPVNIRVTDANDNAPEFVNAPYVLNISEVTVVGTRVLQGVRAIDADQPGPFSTVQYAVLPGPHSDYFVFVNALEGTLVLKKPLDYEALTSFSVNIKAQDQGTPPRSSTTTLYVNIIDADDQNPAFQNEEYKIIIPRQHKPKQKLDINPGPIKALDQDTGINAPVRYTIQGAILPFLNLDEETAEITMIRPLYDHELSSPATIVIKATQVDNADRYALSTIVVSRRDSYNVESTALSERAPIRFIQKDHQASILENTPPGSVILTVEVNKPDSNLRFWLVGPTEDLEKFAITNSGELVLRGSLDYEKRVQHSFFVRVTDNHHHNDTSRVNVSVKDVNEWEPRFRHPRYEFHATSLKEGSIIGKLEVADGDRDDKIHLSLRGPDARSFKINDNGELIIKSAEKINGTLARLVAVASDSGRPPRSSMIPVIVHISGNNALLNTGRTAPAWLGSSVLLVAGLGATLGLLGVVILALILYIYKHKEPKRTECSSTAGSDYRDKSPVPSALGSGPPAVSTNIFPDSSGGFRIPRSGSTYDTEQNEDDEDRSEDNEHAALERGLPDSITNNCRPNTLSSTSSRAVNSDIERHCNEKRLTGPYGNPMKGFSSIRALPLHGRQKVAPLVPVPGLNATSTIPNNGELVQNMNDLSAKTNLMVNMQENYSEDVVEAVGPAWPTTSVTPKIKKLSWDDDDRTVDSVEIAAETKSRNDQVVNERLNLTVYF